MKLYIKNMLSIRCQILVQEELKRLKIQYNRVDLGMVDLDIISIPQKERLILNLLAFGLEIHENSKSILAERIKTAIILMIRNSDGYLKINYSAYLSETLSHDYTYLSNVFSEVKGISIQQYIIFHKIERVKELIQFDELNLSEISYKLHYSSVGHLSTQFKKVTGISPSFYRGRELALAG